MRKISEDYVGGLLMVELRIGLWGLLGGDYGVLGTFFLDSQPLEEFLIFFWSMKSSSILFMSCLFWEIWPMYGEVMSNFLQGCAKNFSPFLALISHQKLSLMMK